MEAQDVFDSDGYDIALPYTNTPEQNRYKINKIYFEQSPFSYVVEYIEADDITKITCSHDEEYYCWSNIISEPIRTEKHSQNQANFDIAITPKLLLTILKEFHKGKLANTFKLKFPKEYKTVTTDLFVEINTKLPYSDDIDIKFICLKPDSITEADRFDFKLDRMKRTIEKENSIVVSEFQSEITKLTAEIEKLNNKIISMDKKMDTCITLYNIKNFATKDDLDKVSTEIQNINNKIIEIEKEEEYDGPDFAFVDDLEKCATKVELAKYATKQELCRHGRAYIVKLAGYATKNDLDKYALKVV